MKEKLVSTEIIPSNRIETPFEWQMGGPESFLNQKFTQIQTSSKKSLLKLNAANFVSQSYQTSSIPLTLHDCKNSNLNSIKEENYLQNHSAQKNPTIQETFPTKQPVLKTNEQAAHHAFTRVYVMGETKYGQLGFMLQADQESVIRMPKMCSYNILIKQIACGEAHTHILSRDGFVYSMGSNHYGVLGLSVDERSLNNVTEPQLITTLSSITQIATGRAHSLALAANRSIYAWGRQENGALSIRIACTSVPAVLDFNLTSKKGSQLAQVVKVACGLEHSMFLTNDGEVFVCGQGENGQLGLGYCSLIEYRPLKVRFKELLEIDYIVDIACGAYHSLFLSRHHQVFSTGLNNLGQLGIATDDQKIYVPQIINELQGRFITTVEAGESSFALNDQGDLFVWGLYNSQVFNKPFRPSSITLPIKKVSQSFYGITAAVDFENRFWVWDSKSQNSIQNLELQSYPSILRPMRNKHVTQAFTGRGMVFALGEDLNPGQVSPKTNPEQQKQKLQKLAEASDTADETCQSNIQIQFSDRVNIQKPKIPDLNLTEIISEECTDKKPVRKRSKSKHSSQCKSRQRSKGRSVSNAKRNDSLPKSEKKKDMPLVAKTPSRSGSREVNRLGMSRSFYDKKTIALLKALKIINQATAEVQNVNTSNNLVSKKFQQLQKKLEEDAIDSGKSKTQINRLKSKSKPRQLQQYEPTSNKESLTKLKENLKKKSKRKTSRSHSRGRSKGRASSGKSKKKVSILKEELKLKSVNKQNSLTELCEQSKTIEEKHKFEIFSAAKEISGTMPSPVNVESIQIYQTNKVIDDYTSHESSILIQEKKPSLKPLSDSQFEVQHQALESYQEYAKTTMQSLYHKIDEMRSENAQLKRELDLQKKYEAIAKEELIKNKGAANLSLINADRQLCSVESKLRTLQIENETLKLQKSDAERKIAVLEDRITKLQMSKSKEDDYLAQLGKSCETLRKERTHIKDLQNEVQSFTKALAIVEATLGQVKQDKSRLEIQNRSLQDQLNENTLYQGLGKNKLQSQKSQLSMLISEAQNNKISNFESQQSQLSQKMREVQSNLNIESQMNHQLSNNKQNETNNITGSRLESQRSNFSNKFIEVVSKQTQEEQRSEKEYQHIQTQIQDHKNVSTQSQHFSQRSRSDVSGSALAKNVKLKQSSKNSCNQSCHSSKSGSYAQIIHHRKSQSSLNEDDKQSRGRNHQLVDQVFKRSVEGSSENKQRSQQNSRSNKRKPSLNMTDKSVKTSGGFIQERLGIKPNQEQNSDIYQDKKPKKQSHFDTKETGRFVDPQLSTNQCYKSNAEADFSKNQEFYTRNTKSQLDVRKQNFNGIKPKQHSPQRGSPLRLKKEDESKHQPLRDKQGDRAVPVSNDYNSDLNVNALQRFGFIHKKSGDTFQDLERNQRYGHFPPQQSETSAVKDYQITAKGYEIEPEEVQRYRNLIKMQPDDFFQDEHPVSDETRREIKALKTNAIHTQATSKRSEKQEQPLNMCYETEQPDSRRRQEDFKTFTPSMRYRDDSPEGKKQIQRFQGLEKENIKPEDRLSRQEQYNMMLINNLEKLAEKKKEALQFSNRDSRSKDSHEKFVQILELPQASKISSPARSNSRSSQPRFGSALNQYSAMNSQSYPFRKQNCMFELDQSYAIVPIQEQIRSRSRGSYEANKLSQSNNSTMADAQRKKMNTPAISDNTSHNSFLAKREALQNRLRNL